MSITVVPSVVTGQTFSAANYNTQVRDNINGLWVATTAGDLIYATGASAAARLALVVGGVMYGGASAPAWLAKPAADSLLKNTAAGVPSWAAYSSLFPGTTAGDVDYYTAASVKARLAKPAADSLLKNTAAGVPSWAAYSTLFPGTTAGDIDYYTAASVKTRLALGALHTFQKSNGSTPAWGALVYRRQGNNATDWSDPGTTAYTPTITNWQCGMVNVPVVAGRGSVTVTFPIAYSAPPLVLVNVNISGYDFISYYSDVAASNFILRLFQATSADTLTVKASWMAVGQ